MSRVAALLALSAAWLLAACAPRDPLVTQESYVFGTRVEILVWGESEDRVRPAMAEVLREFDRLHRAYHAWQPSELTALNEALATGKAAEVSPELAGFVREAQTLAARGDHLFDPGIGALVKLWGFHDDGFKAELPDAGRLDALVKAHPSLADLRVDGNRVASRNATVAIDFGGYLKGVALDRAAAVLKRYKIRDALINIGGNVMALGDKGGRPWRVGIQHPRLNAPLLAIDLKDGEAVGTSGDYQRYFEVDGRRYSHLLDPRTGRPAAASQAVTVIVPPRADAGTWSDWASKPMFIAGDQWRPMADRLGLELVLRIDAAGKIEMTDTLRARLGNP